MQISCSSKFFRSKHAKCTFENFSPFSNFLQRHRRSDHQGGGGRPAERRRQGRGAGGRGGQEVPAAGAPQGQPDLLEGEAAGAGAGGGEADERGVQLRLSGRVIQKPGRPDRPIGVRVGWFFFFTFFSNVGFLEA